MDTYKIVKFVFEGETETVLEGLSLEEAQEYCQRDDTKGENWFCGYTKE